MTETARLILVVEDEPLIRMLAVDMLEMLDFAVYEAGDGREALAVPEADLARAHALMIDLGLPDMPGEEVIRKLLDRRPDLPVIVTTGADASAAAARLRDQAQVSILEKPYQYKDLEQVLAGLQTAG